MFLPVLMSLWVSFYLSLFDQFIAFSPAPSPSAPVINVITRTTSLRFTWTQPEGEIVSHYVIAASYVGDCPEINDVFQGSTFPNTTLDFSDLQEYSNYSLSVSAVNGAGSSETSTLVATTLSTGKHTNTTLFDNPPPHSSQ